MSDSINIVFASDNNYAQHTSVAMASILCTTLDVSRVRFFLISDNISGEIKEKILKTALHNAIINDKEKVTMDDIYFALNINKYKKEEIKGMFE